MHYEAGRGVVQADGRGGVTRVDAHLEGDGWRRRIGRGGGVGVVVEAAAHPGQRRRRGVADAEQDGATLLLLLLVLLPVRRRLWRGPFSIGIVVRLAAVEVGSALWAAAEGVVRHHLVAPRRQGHLGGRGFLKIIIFL